jgi:circadian clock protein KaiB
MNPSRLPGSRQAEFGPEIASSSPQVFKGIALFTPGGDVVYCVDFKKQARWHLQLCATVQTLLGLSEPPHFLVPCFTATVDRWRDPATGQLRTAAEAYPLVMRHRAILNALFQVGALDWQPLPAALEACHPLVIARYREQFPQLWENHDLVVALDEAGSGFAPSALELDKPAQPQVAPPTGYVLRLFVSGHSMATVQILESLHQRLEQCLRQPYTLKVIDVHKNPEQAEADQISATPTLVKAWPQPVRRLVGDLDNAQMIARLLAM